MQVVAHEMAVIQELLGLSDQNDIALVDEGWDSRVYTVTFHKSSYIFKFPRSDKVAQSYSNEIATLKLLESIHSSIAVPIVKWQHPENAYFGYFGVPGASVKSRIKDLTDLEREHIGESLGHFLKEIHGLELPGAPQTALQDELADYRAKYEQALAVLMRALTEPELEQVERFFTEELPSEMVRLGYEPKFCHGDFLLNNILVDANDRVGVIDFGDAGYYDESKDFSSLWDAIIRNAALKAYGYDSSLADKIKLRVKALPILSLSYFIGKRDQAGIERQIQSLRANFLFGAEID